MTVGLQQPNSRRPSQSGAQCVNRDFATAVSGDSVPVTLSSGPQASTQLVSWRSTLPMYSRAVNIADNRFRTPTSRTIPGYLDHHNNISSRESRDGHAYVSRTCLRAHSHLGSSTG